MSTSGKQKALTFKDRYGATVATYNGTKDVVVSGADFGDRYEGVGAIKITDTNTDHSISVSLDKAAEETGKTVEGSTISDIVGMLGGTAVPPPVSVMRKRG